MDKGNQKAIGLASALLAGFALLGVSLVAITNEVTKERIAEQKHRALLRGLNEVIPAELYDNDIANDLLEIEHPLLGSDDKQAIYRARKDNAPIAVAISTTAPDGYDATPIQILVGINQAGELLGVRVVSHKETPGLGDKVSTQKSDWIFSFNGKSLNNPAEQGWRVAKDGGEFDQFSGATITPRAVVRAVHKALRFYQQEKDRLFAQAENTEATDD